jgi:hypothetical protein
MVNFLSDESGGELGVMYMDKEVFMCGDGQPGIEICVANDVFKSMRCHKLTSLS